MTLLYRPIIFMGLIGFLKFYPDPISIEQTSITTLLVKEKPVASFADSLIAEGATLQRVSNEFKFTEGPTVDKKGNIYFTDQPNNRIWKYDVNGKLSVFMENAGRPNGLFIDRKGNIITCAEEKDELWCISTKKKVTVLLKDFDGRRLNGPNDLWVDKKGGVYFTDPYYQRDFWDRKSPDIKEQRVYYLPKGKKEAIIVVDDMMKPNGIVGTPDNKHVYISDIGGNKTYRYERKDDGTLTSKQLVFDRGSDGMTLDNQGNIYTCGRGVSIYSKDGKLLKQISVPSSWTANVCFGGKDRNILFITASESVYTIKMAVKGVE